ncbi:MAG: phosphoglycerate dehydrogenase [Eubacteriales bacterium]|nr:phosphoglycerate dehydrogenase [Eubacteriales bacterium]
MYKYKCLNAISSAINTVFDDQYEPTEDMDQADAIIVRSAKMHDFEFSDDLLAIARAGVGVNNIPLERCAEQGIVVFNAPGANANGVKELVIASLINGARNIPDAIRWVKDNADDPDLAKDVEKGKKKYVGTEIKGKSLGVIGLGAIGGMVANAADVLGMNVYGVDPFLSVRNALSLSRNVRVLRSRDELYGVSDFITVHLHLTDETRGMIDKDAFESMNDGVILLNFSRGEVVDEQALADALESGKVRKYVTDFADPEIMKLPNVIATPHLGASTTEAEVNCAIMAAEELRDYLENGNITNSVNFPACNAGVCRSKGRITVAHKNTPAMLNKFTKVFSDENINIANMTNQTRGDYAYCIFDIDSETTDLLIDDLKAIDGVIRVRKIK